MNRYTVKIRASFSTQIDVVAENEDEALTKAQWMAQDGGQVDLEAALSDNEGFDTIEAVEVVDEVSLPEGEAYSLLHALKNLRASLRRIPNFDSFSVGEVATADSYADAIIAKAEGRA